MEFNISLSRPIAAEWAVDELPSTKKNVLSLFTSKEMQRRGLKGLDTILNERQLARRPEGLLSIHMGGLYM